MSQENSKLVVAFTALNDSQREQIRECAASFGCRAVFTGSRDEALKEAEDAEVLLAMDSSIVKAGKDIRWVCTPSAGVNHYLDVLTGTDIMLTNSSGAYGLTIAEHIIMVTLEIMRKRPEYVELVSRRKWKNDIPVSSINGARITLAGTGDIGTETAKRLVPFGPASITGINKRGQNPGGLFDRIVPLSEIDSVLPETDVLILSLPSTAETRSLLTRERLQNLPEGAYLINVGRGDVLDEKALEDMLREGRLGGAALDVFEKEPLDPESTLWDCPHLVLTTHVAGNWTLPYTVQRIVEMFLEDMKNYFEGQKLKHLVDLETGY